MVINISCTGGIIYPLGPKCEQSKMRTQSLLDGGYLRKLFVVGLLVEIVTDNGGPFRKAVRWLEQKIWNYGDNYLVLQFARQRILLNDLIGILDKCCTKLVEVTFLSGGVSCLMYFGQIASLFGSVLGARRSLWSLERHPTIPLDVTEATWLVELPDRVLMDDELIRYRHGSAHLIDVCLMLSSVALCT